LLNCNKTTSVRADVAMTYLTKVVGRTASTGDERDDTIALEKLLEVALYGVNKRLVGRDLQFPVEKRLHDHTTRRTTAYSSLI